MNTKLPEEQGQMGGGTKTVITAVEAQQEIADLHKILAGNKAFKKCRGNFHEFPYMKMLTKNGKAIPVSAVRKKCSEWLGSQRVMLGVLAILKRSGYDIAFKELERALCDNDYVITGETIPVKKTEPGVLIICDLAKTMLLARWMYTSTRGDGYTWLDTGRNSEDRGLCGSLSPMLFETFPELKEKFIQFHVSHPESPTVILHDRLHEVWGRLRNKYSSMQVHGIFIDQSRTDLWYFENIIGIFVSNTIQVEVLSLFKREEQKSMSTWRFDYPKTISGDMDRDGGSSPNLWVGLHQEVEHQSWKDQWPSYVSRSCTSGYGAVILDDEHVRVSSNLQKAFRRYETFVTVHPNYVPKDLMTRRIIFGFPYSG